MYLVSLDNCSGLYSVYSDNCSLLYSVYSNDCSSYYKMPIKVKIPFTHNTILNLQEVVIAFGKPNLSQNIYYKT